MSKQQIQELFARALALHQQGRLDEAEILYKSVIEKHPTHADALMLLGTIQAQRGNLDEAVRLFGFSLQADPRQLTALSNRGIALVELRRHVEALNDFDAAIALKPDFTDAFLHRGNALAELKRYDEALKSYEKVTSLHPRHALAFNNHGNVLAELGRLDEAVHSYDRAIAAAPDYAEAHYNKGITLKELNRTDDAIRSYDRAIVVNPGYAEAYFNRGLALMQLERHAPALESFDRAAALSPSDAETFVSRGIALAELKQFDAALVSYDRAIELSPENAGAWNNRGNLFKSWGRLDEALDCYDRAIELTRDFADAHANRAITLQELRRHEDAMKDFDRALQIDPNYPYAAGQRIHAQMSICAWKNYQERCAAITDATVRGERASTPFPVLTIPSTPEIQKASAETYVKDKYPPRSPPRWTGRRYAHDRIRIGYFSADFYNHPTSFLMAGVLEQHDKSHFEITGFSFGAGSDNELSARLKSIWDGFFDVRTYTDQAIATLAREHEIDIAIDLWGYTRDFRAGIFSHRPAPLQVNYLGYPGTMGAPYIDYIMADNIVIPEDRADRYSESVVYLPHTYQPNDDRRSIIGSSMTRATAGLPAQGIVFCCFNNNFKITPDVFDIWMRLLGKVDGSVLWLLEDNPHARANLTTEARNRGIAPGQLVFAPRVSLADHMARHVLADLFLDTLHYNAHTTASDALWAGLPLITCIGHTFAARVAASLLTAAGVPELIANSREEYEKTALTLARDNILRGKLREKLMRNRSTHPLFNTRLYTRNLEAAYIHMHQRQSRGEAPVQFTVNATGLR